MAVITDIAEAVVVQMNGGTFSQTFTAERAFLPVFELSDLKNVRVTVVPGALPHPDQSRDAVGRRRGGTAAARVLLADARSVRGSRGLRRRHHEAEAECQHERQ